MKSQDEMIRALQNPQKAPFSVTFEIFASFDRKKIAKWPKRLLKLPEEIEKSLQDAQSREYVLKTKGNFNEEDERAKIFEFYKKRELTNPADRLLKKLTEHTKRYEEVKEYFKQKIRELPLSKPLIFFDDEALRIDIGYGPKEISALFPDFFFGVFYRNFMSRDEPSLFWGPSPLKFFVDNYIEEDYQDFLIAEEKRILSRASIELNKGSAPKRKVNIEEIKSFKEEEKLIKKCFEMHRGLIIGEKHEDKSPKQFLVDNMPLFASQGVTTIYMEHLLQERHQLLLDTYLDSATDEAMPRELELYLNYLDEERELSGFATFTAVVTAAKNHRIRIIAIDSEAIYRLGVRNSVSDLYRTDILKNRFIAMNIAMLDRYTEFDDGQKYIAFIGSGHVSRYLNVPGVSDLLGSPNIVVTDLAEDIEEYIEEDTSEDTCFDMLYYRHKATKQMTDKKQLEQNFHLNKHYIQAQFIKNLNELNSKFGCNQGNLYTPLFQKQEEFFNALTIELNEEKLKSLIIDFRKFCKENIENADKIMGHGWLYRITEVLIKAVVGLFVGIGMVIGSLVGQGLVKSEHRQIFANTFFTLNQTDESKALDKFKQNTLGDKEKDHGLLDLGNLMPHIASR